MRVVLRVLIGLGVVVLLVVAFTVGRLAIGDGPPTCKVVFGKGGYAKAALPQLCCAVGNDLRSDFSGWVHGDEHLPAQRDRL